MKFKLVIDKTKDEEIVATVHGPSDLTAQIEDLVLRFGGTDKIAAFNEDDWILLPLRRIECFTVIDGKTWAIDDKGKRYRIRQRLYEVEKLVPSCFIRINKSTLANETRLERFRATFSGAVDAVFKCGHTDYVSRRCFAEIKRRFDSK